MLGSVVTVAEPNMLRGSSAAGMGISSFPIMSKTTRPAYRADLTYRVNSTEQDKSVSLPAKGKYVERRTDSGADRTSGRKRRLLCNGEDTGCVESRQHYWTRKRADFPVVLHARELG